MKSSRFSIIILITLFITAFWISPLSASGDPWDGTKSVDTLALGNGEVVKVTDDDGGIDENGDENTPIVESIIDWIKNQFVSDKTNHKLNRTIQKMSGKRHQRMYHNPNVSSFSKD